MIKTTLAGLFLFGMGMLYGAEAAAIKEYHPICTEVAHEVTISWHEGEISREEAVSIIDNCFAWQDRQ